MSEVISSLLSKKIGSTSLCMFLTLMYLLIGAGCNKKISSKLEATEIIVPPGKGQEIEKDGVTVSIEEGTFAERVEITVNGTDRGIEISTVSQSGAKVLSEDVLKSMRFCSSLDLSYSKENVYIIVDVSEDQSPRQEIIANGDIEFSEVEAKPRACWYSKYVNASFKMTMDGSSAVARKLTDPNCIDPDLSLLSNDGILTLCDGTTARGTLDLTSVAAYIKAGKSIAGIAGTYTPDFPNPANVYNDTVNGIAGTLTLPSAASVRVANGAFGPAGSGVIPSLADCNSDGGTGCVAVPAFKAADMTNVVAAKIKSGVTIAGVVGDYPSATNALAGADGTADLNLATFDAKIKAATDFEWFDSAGTRYVNSGDADIVDTNILNTANIFGTSGSVMVPPTPDAWDIRVGQTINGVAGKLKVACRNSANTAVFDAGEFKNATADNTTDLFTVTSHGYADNDTIRFTAATEPTGLLATATTYYVRSSTANTFQLSESLGGGAVDFTTDGADIVVYKWGGGVLDIWDTVDDYNNNGASFTEVNMPSAWSADNFCGGVGTASSSAVWMDTTTDGTCDNEADDCRFKDKISGLEWSEIQSTGAAWGSAINICANLNFGGADTWRLPTQKELMAAYEHGIYSVPNSNWLSKSQMNQNFWTSTTRSNDLPTASFGNVRYGTTNSVPKVNLYYVTCVR